MDDHQRRALKIILSALETECRDSPLGNLLEGHLKVVAIHKLLGAGYSVMEGSNVPDRGRVISLERGRLRQTLEPRPHIPAASGSGKLKNSPDLRVWQPCRLVVELQVRSEFGSQSALFSDNLADDLDRIMRGSADAFILAADRGIYESLRGLKADPRGRPAKHTERFEAVLPPTDQLPDSLNTLRPIQSGELLVAAAMFQSVA